jgi:hypothetical protein
LLVFFKKEKKKSKLTKNKEVEGPMCFEDQTILPINRGHNTHKKWEGGGNFETLEKTQKKP